MSYICPECGTLSVKIDCDGRGYRLGERASYNPTEGQIDLLWWPLWRCGFCGYIHDRNKHNGRRRGDWSREEWVRFWEAFDRGRAKLIRAGQYHRTDGGFWRAYSMLDT